MQKRWGTCGGECSWFPTGVVMHTPPSLISLRRDVVRGTNLEVVKVAPRYGNLAS
ncbi:hypothetical protein HanPI659440_Chr07g0252621 [Helianthus annuus]|nr:hypothetical protein HanPI659440_Chr07g0252621 [Helianthus annuus]